ncbi:hypothetical protein CSA37_03860 [Candidatus Fermentibacteria bacterium]|nr:MAG: hypothetical protein CSA37_03860 [Candidatus Fermentibacteria bacterium]
MLFPFSALWSGRIRAGSFYSGPKKSLFLLQGNLAAIYSPPLRCQQQNHNSSALMVVILPSQLKDQPGYQFWIRYRGSES